MRLASSGEPIYTVEQYGNHVEAFIEAGKREVGKITLRPYERGTTLFCDDGVLKRNLPYQQIYDPPDNEERCAISITPGGNDIGWAHTHPTFVISTEPILCRGQLLILDTAEKVNQQYLLGEVFSEQDILTSQIVPGFLHTSLGNKKGLFTDSCG